MASFAVPLILLRALVSKEPLKVVSSRVALIVSQLQETISSLLFTRRFPHSSSSPFVADWRGKIK
jgi:hypothetical protein